MVTDRLQVQKRGRRLFYHLKIASRWAYATGCTVVLIWFLSTHLHLSAKPLSEKIRPFLEKGQDTTAVLPKVGKTLVFLSATNGLIQQDVASNEKKLSYIDLQKGVLWEKSLPGLYRAELTSNRSGNSKVTAEYVIEEGRIITELYSADGRLLAKVEAPTYLRPSPSGAYLYSSTSPMGPSNLQVYDSVGNLLWKRFPSEDGFWHAAALSDSLMVYADTKKLTILDVWTGGQKLEVPGDHYNYDVDLLGKFINSGNGEFFILRGYSTLFSFSSKDGLLWKTSFNPKREYVGDISLSESGRFVVYFTVPVGQPSQRILRIVDNLTQGKVMSEINFDSGRPYHRTLVNSVSISDGIATIFGPSMYDFEAKGLTSEVTTKCFFFNSANGAITDSLTVQGILQFSASSPGDFHLNLLTISDREQVLHLLKSRKTSVERK